MITIIDTSRYINSNNSRIFFLFHFFKSWMSETSNQIYQYTNNKAFVMHAHSSTLLFSRFRFSWCTVHTVYVTRYKAYNTRKQWSSNIYLRLKHFPLYLRDPLLFNNPPWRNVLQSCRYGEETTRIDSYRQTKVEDWGHHTHRFPQPQISVIISGAM